MEITTIYRERTRWYFAAMFLVLLASGGWASAQSITVAGAVTDDLGETLPGVNIVVKGTTTGVTTESNGKYSITVDAASTLVYSFLGFMPTEEVINNRTVINVVLTPDIQTLNEIVVVGYGTQKRETITGSIASVKSADFNAGQINDPITLISGKVAGLAVSNSSRSDPNATADFSLRGPATVEGNSRPLIVIDGIPGGDLQTIAPGDIASIDVLKDGSAAAIYGSRATAGVILITTKKGVAGKPKLNYTGYVTTDLVAKKYDMLNAAEYRALGEEYGFAVDDAGADTDWFDEVTRTPISHSHNLSLSGGNDKTTYYASLNYRDMQGIDLVADREFINGTFRLTTKALNDKLDFSLMLVNSFENKTYANYGAIAQSLNMNPTFPVRNPDGTFYQRPDIQFGLQWNPVASTRQNYNSSKEKKFLSTLNAAYHLTSDLTAAVSYSMIRNDALSGSYASREDFFQMRDGVGGLASRAQANMSSNVLETTLNYSRNIGNHNIDVVGGYSYQNIFNEGFSGGNNNFSTDAFRYYNLGAGTALNNLTPNFNRSGVFLSSYGDERSLVAYFGRVIYDFQEKYLASVSVRREGASVLGHDNKWGTFFGVSGGWVISKESFLEGSTLFTNLKLRAGYGVTGNQESLSPYQSLATISPFGGGLQNGYYNGNWIQPYGPSINANPDLKWETKKEFNAGIDFAFFESGWLSGSLDYYNRRIEDLVGNYTAQVPSEVNPTIFANAGEMVNEGFELALNAQVARNNNFHWNVILTGAYNRNEIKSVSSDQFFGTAHDITRVTEGNTIQRLAPGQPVAVFYGREFAGLTEDGQWLFRNKAGDAVPAADITIDDFTYLGNSIPKYSLGLTNTFNIGKFDASILLRGAFGFKAVNAKRMFHENLTYYARNNFFTSVTDDRVMDAPTFSSYYLENGAYMKVDNITVGYTLPMANSNYVQSIRFYVTGANLLTVTGFSGTDPELGVNYYAADPNAETSDGPGVESNYSYYPNTRSLTAGISLSF
ncbi:SusC/RagA family TonB-linked outer membrane protein [Fulvivirgaceae bacterium PWU5]|uniref:SusC/RagA family TonB-linked outer membrane protein n=1 Tax=Dawidia cretensis TaxID=2782350 RepID=A0AAP2GX15_9BACT|nr:SusC/RagA family TonB-linked outer membrane protein [Dawidia cretensis]MBT1711987.1 SusC/RagA family TonB-linked outer membrane protein [Dawidia cretensis]